MLENDYSHSILWRTVIDFYFNQIKIFFYYYSLTNRFKKYPILINKNVQTKSFVEAGLLLLLLLLYYYYFLYFYFERASERLLYQTM